MSALSTVTNYLPLIRGELSKLRVPTKQDKVYKDECIYSFDSPYTDTGLYVNIVNWQGVGKDYLLMDAKKTHSKLYLHEQWTQVPVVIAEETTPSAPSKLAIGVTGGFLNNTHKDKVEKKNSLVIVADGVVAAEFDLSDGATEQNLPEFLVNVIQAIIDHEGIKANLALSSWEADQEVKIVSKYAQALEQLNPENKRISQRPQDWKDEASDATDNLWLNLSTGYIGGGRKNWDGTGGSGSALQHYIDTGYKYPLAVKLGTITPTGADVWSYSKEEDCLVDDPLLSEHLSFWGIDIMKLEKVCYLSFGLFSANDDLLLFHNVDRQIVGRVRSRMQP
jgi:ubiquitin carboxyl-terminal hydrolase 5/13